MPELEPVAGVPIRLARSSTRAQEAEACPICAGTSLRLLHRITAGQAARHFLPPARNPQRHASLVKNIEGLWQGSDCRFLQCQDCRFAFPIPYVAGDADFYELAYGTPSYPRHRWEYGRAIAILQSLSPPGPRRVLELGAGMGQFIKRLLRIPDFTRERIVATEYCPASIHALRSLGVQAERCGVIDLAAGAGHQASFDAACAFQSFEHMANAVEVIFALKKLVKPGGLIILSVPHGPAIDFNERYLSCLDMPPNHVGRWYRESFEVLAKKAELELTRHEIEPRRLLQVLREVALLRLHARAGSNPRSLAARAQTLGNQGLRRTWSAALGSLMLPPLLPAMRCLRSGFSQLVVLRVPR